MVVETEVQQTLLTIVVWGLRNIVNSGQYWTGGLPVVVSHFLLEKSEEKCWGLVEIMPSDDIFRYLNIHCLACNKCFRVNYSNFSLKEVCSYR